MAEKNSNLKHLVRVKNTDIDGNKQAYVALSKIKGVGFMMANAVCQRAGVEKTQKIGEVPDEQVSKIEEVFDNPSKFNIPSWMLNRRNDYEEGVDKHLYTSDLEFTHNNELRRMQKTKSYRGLRLSWGLTVRGQRTKAHFRKGTKKGLGVKRKK
ncbi:MAG: 30S ribosomal protein S13 [Candidatus Nanoarchaeia archaeon]